MEMSIGEQHPEAFEAYNEAEEAVARLEARMASKKMQSPFTPGDLAFLPHGAASSVLGARLSPAQALEMTRKQMADAFYGVGMARAEKIREAALDAHIKAGLMEEPEPNNEPVDYDGNVPLLTVDGEVKVYVAPDGRAHITDGVVYGHLPVKDYSGEPKLHTERFTHSFEYSSRVEAGTGWTFGWKPS